MTAKPWVGKSVVIIDDSEQVRVSLDRAFKAAGMQVVGLAQNGVEGLEMVRQFKPEIASIDIIMPEMDGIECLKRIRIEEPNTKCFFVTWLAAESRVIEALAKLVPAYAFQPKLFTAKDIEERISMLYFPPQMVQQPVRPEKDMSNIDLVDLGIKEVS